MWRYLDFLLEYQLTCKSWSSLAQSKFYESIILKDFKQLDLLIDSCSRIKYLVHCIMFDVSIDDDLSDYDERQIIIASFRKIALYFTELENVYHNFDFKEEIWQVIKSERSRGRFSKLQDIRFIPSTEHHNIVQYNKMAWELRRNLRILEVYDISPEPAQNTERLSYFTSLNEVYFKFRDLDNLYTIDQQIKKSASIHSVNVDFPKFTEGIYDDPPAEISKSVHVLPHIRVLFVRRFLYDCNSYSYIMKVFPNLDTLDLITREIPELDAMPSLSTETAIQFLRYLLRIPYTEVIYVLFENLHKVLMEFYDQRRIIKSLDICYVPYSILMDHPSYLTVHSTDDDMCMEIYYEKRSSKVILPCVGLIEKNGGNLQQICINMGFEYEGVKALVNKEDSDSLSRILSQCPNLKHIQITHTLLRDFGTCMHAKTKDSVHSRTCVWFFIGVWLVFI